MGDIDIENNKHNNKMISDIINSHIEETITDEQISIFLEPVFRMIKEGRFDEPKKRRILPILSLAAIFVLTFIVVFTQGSRQLGKNIMITEQNIPLADAPFSSNSLKGRVHLKEKGLEGITVELRDYEGKIVLTGITDEEGEFSFNGFSSGTYILEVYPPENMKILLEKEEALQFENDTEKIIEIELITRK